MKFFYIFAIFCAIFILALIFVNSIEAFVARSHHSKSHKFGNEALGKAKDLDSLADSVGFNGEHGRRQRRETLDDYFNNYPDRLDNKKLGEEQINSKCNLRSCKSENCEGVLCSNRLKHSLNPSNELNELISDIKRGKNKISRDISLFGSEQNFENNPEQENQRLSESEESGDQSKGYRKSRVKSFKSDKLSCADNRNKHMFEDANYLHKSNKYPNYDSSPNLHKSFLEEDNSISSDSDLSSCQHCSEHADSGNLKNNYNLKSKTHRPLVIYEKKSKSYKESKQLKDSQPFRKTFDQKYGIENQDDDEEDDDVRYNLYQIKPISVQLKGGTKHEYDNLNNSLNKSNLAPLEFNSESSNSSPNTLIWNFRPALNDQIENTKNNLSHEANYKLSKNEQDASEKKKDFSWNWGIFKRSYNFNPMNEIKLKTSNRLMRKGFGASLPSYSLGETRRELMIDNMLRRREQQLIKEKERKYNSLKEPLEENVRETDINLDDLENMQFEPVLSSLSLMDQGFRRLKRINYDYENNNPEPFDNLKEKTSEIQNFENMNFDNLRKRFSKYKLPKIHDLKIFNKRHNFPNFKNNKTENNVNYTGIKSPEVPLKVKTLKDNYRNDLRNFNQNYKFNENNFNWQNSKLKSYKDLSDNATSENDDPLSLELRNEILNCKAFSSLEEFLKSLPKNVTESILNGLKESTLTNHSRGQIEMNIITPPMVLEETTTSVPADLDSTIPYPSSTEEDSSFEIIETTTAATEEIFQPTEEDLELPSEWSTEEEEDMEGNFTDSVLENATVTECLPSETMGQDDVKLNITINANVHGNPNNKHFCGNGSFNVIPGFMDGDDDRSRRGTFFLPLEINQKRKSAEVPTQKPYDSEDNEDLNDLISGKLSSNIVKSILNTVQESPHLKTLWPSLKRNQPLENIAKQNFYAIRNQENENEIQNSEKLLAQVMLSLNSIIEQQARSHACVPLRPDLQEFYNTVLQSRQEQDMVREKRQLIKSTRREDFSSQINLLDSNKIEEQTKIVKELLKQLEESPQEDQLQVAAVRDELLRNLFILRQLQDDEEKQKREFGENKDNAKNIDDEEILKSLGSVYSSKFLKLLKAAELNREEN